MATYNAPWFGDGGRWHDRLAGATDERSGMSFDLLFCRKGEPGLDPEDLLSWAEKHGHFSKPETASPSFQLLYENEDTGVYFSIDYFPSEADEESSIPEGFVDVGLSFNLNYIRPSFFGPSTLRQYGHL